MDGLETLMEQYADENGCISRDSMRRALETNLGAPVSDGDLDRVMSRLGSSEDHGHSRRVSLVEADAAIKAFRKANSPVEALKSPTGIYSPVPGRGAEPGERGQDMEMAARCDQAELRAMSAEAALSASEEKLGRLVEEAGAAQLEIEQLKQQREAEVHSSCFALEELQAELQARHPGRIWPIGGQDANEELGQQAKARELDQRRIELLTEELEELRQGNASAESVAARCKELEAENKQMRAIEANNAELAASLKESQSEIELLGQRIAHQDEHTRSVTEQLHRYQELLSDTQATLQNQRAIVETLHEAIDTSNMAQQDKGLDLATEHSLAEIDALAKEVSSLSEVLRKQDDDRQQERLSPPPTAQLGMSTDELMANLRSTIKAELKSELSQMRDVLTPTGTPQHTPKHCTPQRPPGTAEVSWRPSRELIDLEYQFQAQAEQMTDQAASIANYLDRLQKACDTFSNKINNKVTSPGGETQEAFVQAVHKLLLKMKKSESQLRDCLQGIFGEREQGLAAVPRETEIWSKRCNPPVLILALQKELVDMRAEESEKILKMQREKEEAIERNALEWKRAIRKAAKRINRDPETPMSINIQHSQEEKMEIENIPPLIDQNIQPDALIEQFAEC